MAGAIPWDKERAGEIIAAHTRGDGPLLPMLHALNREFGHIPDDAVAPVATALNLTRAEVHGVISFYHDFKRAPQGRRVLKLCRAEACQAAGGDEVVARAEKLLGIRMGETTADGQVTLEATYCLGLCPVGPSAMLGERVIGRIDEARVDDLVAEARA